MKLTGKFISLEGVEGVGKSTAMKWIESFLLKHHLPYLLTREPGGTEIAEKIRQILLSPSHDEKMMPETELLLMFASRAQHLAQLIIPALQAGKWVVSDRFVDASYAYQGGGRQVDIEQIALLDRIIVKDRQPELVILLDAPVEVGLQRAQARGEQDRIEQEKVDFFERVRVMYHARAEQHPDRYKIIDATQTLTQVEHQITQALTELMAKHNG